MLAGAIVSCVWKDNQTVDSKNVTTLDSITNQSKSTRRKKTCILAHQATASLIQFGIPRFFFRFSFTSAFSGVAIAYLRNIHAKAESNISSRVNVYNINKNEFISGSHITSSTQQNACPFIEIADLIPSRFAIAGNFHTRISFIPIDYQLQDFILNPSTIR
jgi:hypothetical protein